MAGDVGLHRFCWVYGRAFSRWLGWPLAAVLVLGPRLGRFGPEGREIEPHNMPMAALGMFLIFIGWFGFNGGSTLAFDGSVPLVLVNTLLAAAAGGGAAILLTWLKTWSASSKCGVEWRSRRAGGDHRFGKHGCCL